MSNSAVVESSRDTAHVLTPGGAGGKSMKLVLVKGVAPLCEDPEFNAAGMPGVAVRSGRALEENELGCLQEA